MKIPPQQIKEMQEAAKSPVGTFEFTYTLKEDLFDPKVKGGIIFHLVAGKHYFRLERNDNLEVLYYYSSPGTGTRVAIIDLKEMTPAKKLFIAFTWSPKETSLYIGPKEKGGKLLKAKGIVSKKRFRIGEDGGIYQEGDDGVEVMGVRLTVNGKQVLRPAAINIWEETKKAIEVLYTGESKEGYIFKIVQANLGMVMMVTGFESYCRTRFQELKDEGVMPDQLKIDKKLKNNKENFQEFSGYCREIYKLGYGIKFSELVDSSSLQKMSEVFNFRHRIVHAFSLLDMMNEFKISTEEPIFSTNKMEESLELFDHFIHTLHKETLKLKKKD